MIDNKAEFSRHASSAGNKKGQHDTFIKKGHDDADALRRVSADLPLQERTGRRRTIELLAPAKNLECGMAAIDHGADAVYIGASRFGARQSAGNSVEDIGKLCEYAHRYGATVHVTINTIIYDDEFEDTLALVRELTDAGADAFLLQDMGLMSKVREIVPDTVALHASTQCDTRTWEKAQWLSRQGFDRVVLARELSAEEISEIHKRTPGLELEAFVHGALCVSYSGVCYVSQYCFGRSANRGACAQFCRLAFDLKDSDGKTIEHQRHLLSLKDMSQIDNLETLMCSGACAFKIEGRLKDINYVKNVVSAYSKRIDEIISRHPGEFRRASLGRVRYSFTPDLKKTFNRGYTNYFLKGRQADIFSPDTPKALGEYVGRVKEIRRDSFNVSTTATFANGDGLCFLLREQVSKSADREGDNTGGHKSVNNITSTRLEGFRVNRAVGNRLYPFKMPRGLKPGMALYRNQDQAFDKELSGKTAERKIAVKMWFGASENSCEGSKCLPDSRGMIWVKAQVTGFDSQLSDVNAQERTPDEYSLSPSSSLGGVGGEASISLDLQLAQKPQHDNIVRQLTKTGNTVYDCTEVEIADGADKFFIPSSVLAELRRMVIEKLDESIKGMRRMTVYRKPISKVSGFKHQITMVNPSQYQELPYLYNISNGAARWFYEQQGLEKVDSAFELQYPATSSTLSAPMLTGKKGNNRKDVHAGSLPGKNPANSALSLSEKPAGVPPLLMQCRHCIRYSLGYCVKRGGRKPTWREPLFLELPDKRRFRLEFDCKDCQMNIYPV